MGSSPSSTNNSNDPNMETSERFNFRFTDCSCKCDARKRRVGDVYGQSDVPQVAFMTALMSQMGRSQYDLRCDCDCGEGVKMGFLFGNTPSTIQQQTAENQ